MSKQQHHFRKINNILVGAGKGKKDSLVGKFVWYEGQTYLVVRKNKNNTYELKNLTFHKEAHNVPKNQLRLY